MSGTPRFSIAVVGPGTGGALERLAREQGAGIEVIDETRAANAGEALTRALASAKGEVLGWMAAGDRLLPGALHGAAAAIDAAHGRHVVLGRCAVSVDGVPLEWPSEWRGRYQHLAIWKRGVETVPRPALFWHRDATAGIGPVQGREPYAAHYDLVCRLARRHSIHAVDELWGEVDFAAMLGAVAEAEMLATWVRLGRTHWGSWLSPTRWRCEASWWAYRHHRHDRARHHARLAEIAAQEGRAAQAREERLKTWLLSPAMARGRFR